MSEPVAIAHEAIHETVESILRNGPGGRLLDVPVYDHVIIGGGGERYVSFAEAGLL